MPTPSYGFFTLMIALLSLTARPAVVSSEQGTPRSPQAIPGYTTTTVSAATFRAQPLARHMILTTFGDRLATSTQEARQLPLPNILEGTTLKLVDTRGVDGYANLFFVSPKQVNWVMPDWVANGPVKLTLTSGDGTVSTGELSVENVAPGLFTANASGEGAPAAVVVRVAPGESQTAVPVAQCGTLPGSCLPLHLDLSSDDDAILLLFGTGIRNGKVVSARVGGREADVLAAQAQGTFVGLDQVNVRIPRGPVGAGDVPVELAVDGKPSNVVTIAVGPPRHQLTSVSPQTSTPGQTLPAFTLNGSNLTGVNQVRFYPPDGVSATEVVASAASVTARVSIAATAAPGVRLVCALSSAGRSNCLPFRIEQGGTGASGQAPRIANFRGGVIPAGGVLSFCTGGKCYYAYPWDFDFEDPDGDIVYRKDATQGNARLRIELTSAGKRCTVVDGPDESLDHAGKQKGTVKFSTFLPVRWGNYGYSYAVTLFDAAGHASNTLTGPVNGACE